VHVQFLEEGERVIALSYSKTYALPMKNLAFNVN
jgi:hypothetical protein